MELRTMQNKYKAFVDVCKKYRLEKNFASFQLFHCLVDTLLYVHIDQYEQRESNRLEIAKLIQLFNTDGDIVVRNSKAGNVKLSDDGNRTTLLFFLHKLLQIESCGLYQELGLAGNKPKITDMYKFKGHIYSGWDFYEPYSDGEVDRIIEFESFEESKKNAMKGKADGGIPKLGYFVEKFIAYCPILFGDILCTNAKPRMSPTDMYNLIGEMLVLADVVQMFFPKIWVDGFVKDLNRSQRRKVVKDWRMAYENACKRHIEKSGMVSGTTPEGIMRNANTSTNQRFRKCSDEGQREVLSFYKQAQLQSEKKDFDSLEW